MVEMGRRGETGAHVEARGTEIGARPAIDAGALTSIVFDVDGTLYRQRDLRRTMLLRLLRDAIARPAAALSTFRALQAYRHAQELLRDAEIEGALAEHQLRLACQRARLPEAQVAATVARWMETEPLGTLARFVEPALRTFLGEARRRGLRLGVFSDYPAARKLDSMRLAEYFDVVVCAQDPAVNRFKPHPAGLAETMRRLGADAQRSLYVGDRYDVDAQVARAAGMPCVIVGRRPARAPAGARVDAVRVADYAELRELLFPAVS